MAVNRPMGFWDYVFFFIITIICFGIFRYDEERRINKTVDRTVKEVKKVIIQNDNQRTISQSENSNR